jgi:hypothetical protein
MDPLDIASLGLWVCLILKLPSLLLDDGDRVSETSDFKSYDDRLPKVIVMFMTTYHSQNFQI